MSNHSRHVRYRPFKPAWATVGLFFLALATCGLLYGVPLVFASDPASLNGSEKKELPSDIPVLAKATPTPSATATPTTLPVAPTPLSLASNAAANDGGRIQQPKVESVPVFSSFDFMRGYFTNSTDAMIVDGKPWDNVSMNFAQYQSPGG